MPLSSLKEKAASEAASSLTKEGSITTVTAVRL